MYKLKTIGLSILLLTGCTTTRETFDCKFNKGVGCRSITEVNTMVNEGKLTNNTVVVNPRLIVISKEQLTSGMAVKRVTEEHLRVWVAPHQDENGNFHEATYVHTVLRSGFWQINS